MAALQRFFERDYRNKRRLSHYEYRGWRIEPAGGFITNRRFHATKPGIEPFYLFELKPTVSAIDEIEEHGEPKRTVCRGPAYL